MQKTVRFICCSGYDFKDKAGNRVVGISCKCFDEETKTIIKVKTNHLLDCEFGEEIVVNIVPNGRYINYQIAE